MFLLNDREIASLKVSLFNYCMLIYLWFTKFEFCLPLSALTFEREIQMFWIAKKSTYHSQTSGLKQILKRLHLGFFSRITTREYRPENQMSSSNVFTAVDVYLKS